MTNADWAAEIERLENRVVRLANLVADPTLPPAAHWLAERDLATTRDRLDHARQQVTP